MNQETDLHAGRFSTWLHRFLQVQITDEGMDVPCGDCRLCCTSSYFIHIKSDETEALARIPRDLLFPAPGLPQGFKLLGYDEKGHCPMFIENQCSIYEHRPQACRKYDCRIFPATGLSLEKERMRLSQHTERWKFSFESEIDHSLFAAVRAAARFILEYADTFPAGFIPANLPQQAVFAIKVYEVFLSPDRYLPFCDNDILHEIIRDIKMVLKKFE